MMLHIISMIWRGILYAGLFGTIIANSVGLFNALVKILRLPTALWSTDLLIFWHNRVGWIATALDTKFDWLVPEWPPSLYTIAIMLCVTQFRGLNLFDSSHPSVIKTTSVTAMATSAFLIIFAIPYINILLLVILIDAFLQLLSGLPIFPSEDARQKSSVDIRSFRLYCWGIVVGTLLLLLVNFGSS